MGAMGSSAVGGVGGGLLFRALGRVRGGGGCEACRGRGENLVPAEAGVHALEIVEAAARSARLDRQVAIAEVR